MDANTLMRSIEAITPYFEALAQAGAQGAGMGRLRAIGLDAEVDMLRATGNVNTHRGTIFGMGLLCAAAGRRAIGMARPSEPLGRVVACTWGADIIDGPVLLHSHGQRAHLRYGAEGALVSKPPQVFHAPTRSDSPPSLKVNGSRRAMRNRHACMRRLH
jgi:triphosphoribosyl-dephospho-CoA synthase